jgi:Zn finger protein HypA/HybF involved in hydrogenase expression
MYGIITPMPKLTVLYKCRDCGHKSRTLFGLVTKKCPCCGGSRLKIAVGFENRQPPWIVN